MTICLIAATSAAVSFLGSTFSWSSIGEGGSTSLDLSASAIRFRFAWSIRISISSSSTWAGVTRFLHFRACDPCIPSAMHPHFHMGGISQLNSSVSLSLSIDSRLWLQPLRLTGITFMFNLHISSQQRILNLFTTFCILCLRRDPLVDCCVLLPGATLYILVLIRFFILPRIYHVDIMHLVLIMLWSHAQISLISCVISVGMF